MLDVFISYSSKDKVVADAVCHSLEEQRVMCWYADNTGQTGTRPVRAKKPNELGLYDMSGNVYEWCNDWKYEFTPEDQENPVGLETGIIKASKGGSWHSSTRSLRVSNRDDDPPEFYSHNVGFRIAK